MHAMSVNQTIRLSKAILMSYISFFGVLVVMNNFIDYPANHEYLAHVLSMDTTSNGEKFSYRAITSPIAHHRIYWLIITLEVLFTVTCIIGTFQLFKNLNSSAKKFHEAKKFAIIGLLVATFIYYVFFQVIGVEWFNMDQSEDWNYKEWARHIVVFILPLLIYLTLRNEQ